MNHLRALAPLFLVLCGNAHAEKSIPMEVEVIDVRYEQPTPAKWIRYEGLPSEKVSQVVKEARREGADCHEFKGELLVCRYPGAGPKTVGIDWNKLHDDELKEALDGL
ncbi:hypothetical protein [Pseudomonas mosselii]|uniref:hypothetical protein n=1 Tax=Pseudomonas mosselii TaxID=78327 RepID=UPI0021DAE9E1|nr:hypothetical protein [Pseudomonas mosselii]MCU9528072.1 hypothetical protein [Pseudomonas mosselii]MCU9535181.1 hypothetical protein [Pseudomonas mosselii]MCU9542700.1 hypothetical protein [Pseudomonas mosselii]MCU9546916.1 hypothetical protein [Pseudomonas mosselii]